MKMGRWLSHSRVNNQRGMLSVDFLFAMILAAALCMMMFALTTTLSMLEIAQYIAYSTARAHAPAHETQAQQVALGNAKFKTFMKESLYPNLAPLLKNGWFEVDEKSLDIRGGGQGTGTNGQTFNEEYGAETNALPQEGIRFKFTASILKMNLPFLGSITSDTDFSTFVTGLILREPTSEECRKTLEVGVRYKAIKGLDPSGRFQQAISGVQSPSGGGGHPADADYFPLEDNGC